MKAKAKHWVNYNGTWRRAGEIFPIDEADAAEMAQYAEILESQLTPEPQRMDEPAEPVKRGRKRKTEE